MLELYTEVKTDCIVSSRLPLSEYLFLEIV